MLNLRLEAGLISCRIGVANTQSRDYCLSAEKVDPLVTALYSQNQPISEHATSTII